MHPRGRMSAPAGHGAPMSYYHTPVYKTPLETIEALREAVKLHWEEGEKIISHYKRLEKGYSDWEDRLIEIENAITALEDETGLTKEEVLVKPEKVKQSSEFDLEDFLNG